VGWAAALLHRTSRSTKILLGRSVWTYITAYDLRFSRRWLWRMVSSWMLRRSSLIRIDVSKELSASFIRVTRIDGLGTTLAVTSTRCTLRNVGSYKSHTVYHPRRHHSSYIIAVSIDVCSVFGTTGVYSSNCSTSLPETAKVQCCTNWITRQRRFVLSVTMKIYLTAVIQAHRKNIYDPEYCETSTAFAEV
jgi:hypothetical protein